MAWIALEGMRFYALHGVYEAEKKIGAEYVVDVFVRVNTAKATKADDVEGTINYETIFHICRLEMEKPRKLIETVLESILERMKHQFSTMQVLRVRVRKLNPAVGGRVDCAWVEETLDFVQDCPRCKKKFILYENGDCWAKFPNLHPATRETLERQFGGKCLCDDCLKFYAG